MVTRPMSRPARHIVRILSVTDVQNPHNDETGLSALGFFGQNGPSAEVGHTPWVPQGQNQYAPGYYKAKLICARVPRGH